MTNQQATTAQKIWMSKFIQDSFETDLDVCRQERELNPNDPNFPDLSTREEKIKYIEDGTLGHMVMMMFHDKDFEDEDETKNWDKELIEDWMNNLLDFIQESPETWLFCLDIWAERENNTNNTNEEDESSDDSSDEDDDEEEDEEFVYLPVDLVEACLQQMEDDDEDEYENVRFDEEEVAAQ